MAKLSAEEKKKYLDENKLKVPASMLPKIITTGYHALDLVHFFTGGEDEVRAWTIKVSRAHRSTALYASRRPPAPAVSAADNGMACVVWWR